MEMVMGDIVMMVLEHLNSSGNWINGCIPERL